MQFVFCKFLIIRNSFTDCGLPSLLVNNTFENLVLNGLLCCGDRDVIVAVAVK